MVLAGAPCWAHTRMGVGTQMSGPKSTPFDTLLPLGLRLEREPWALPPAKPDLVGPKKILVCASPFAEGEIRINAYFSLDLQP